MTTSSQEAASLVNWLPQSKVIADGQKKPHLFVDKTWGLDIRRLDPRIGMIVERGSVYMLILKAIGQHKRSA
ncbi:hypothetical protein CEXT_660541 [Caerostris extrusa]|uniref:Uncharacterized protein n=1 Tax=Caerostris extrusa TaxID=172846 RepID=A0AAV4XN61_CAEEX|nr:hypothetical protein CEXT_660541 [Caerostris extrusa]